MLWHLTTGGELGKSLQDGEDSFSIYSHIIHNTNFVNMFMAVGLCALDQDEANRVGDC